MVTDFPIQGILDHLVERIVGVMPVTGAGVTLISPGLAPQYVAASDATALRFERLQTELGRGPCLTAYKSGEAVSVPDLAADDRYPEFAPAALSAGMAAVFTFPLRHGDSQLGALDLYRDSTGMLDAHAMVVAQTLADVAAAYLLSAQARERALAISDRFQDRALHDSLTGLPNRLLLQQRLEHAAQRAQRSGGTVAVLFADLDRFKQVNDSYGHAAGDDLLIAVANRLSALVRVGDTLARVSGDEFVFLCEDLAHSGDVELLAGRIDEAFTVPFVLPGVGTELLITASVGIAYSGPGQKVNNQLLLNADIAMYQAKRLGGADHRVVDLREAKDDDHRNHLEQDLRSATSRGQVDLAYQPIVRACDGTLVGVEALLRWTHPEEGPIPALTTVGLAERNGQITDLGAWVLDRACKDRIGWLGLRPDMPLDLSVNVSARQLRDRDFVATVKDVLEGTGTDPAALLLEITEGIFVEDGDRALSVLLELKALGVRLALDDFGTGYSSLGYLRRFPVDIVKIDRSFVADIGNDPVTEAIVSAVTDLAHVLDLHVTAEGVETEQQAAEMIRIGCEFAQGFLYARPMTNTALRAHLARSEGPALHLPQVPTVTG
jgi:diguanylate cyclase (GGDEF)-like protein